MKPTAKDYANAVGALGILKYFPSGADNREMIMVLMQNICDRKDRLVWLVNTLLNHVGEWPGPAQLRAIYASRWTPADGVHGPPCTIHGFTADDMESNWQARQLTESQQRYLPTPDDMRVTDEERERIAALERKVKLAPERKRPQGPKEIAAEARLKQILGGGS